ncbi:MAG: tryptophan-rich sensory protein [Sphingobacteriales bacterium]|jgi:benzodiazapine receptor|nr:tryptophan-rich sensory protein [Sphingobacteriales bacterium]
MNNYLKAILSIVTCLAVGGISGYITADAIPGWYVTINKPTFNPPNWIFGPVWTTLYIMMGIAFFLIWKSQSPLKHKAKLIFAVQLILNFFWSILFFNFHLLGFALIEILCMWLFILLSIISFYPVSKLAAYLLIPYLLWVSFASILNFAIWQLN